MRKRGFSHVEVILSFVIFTGFLLFLFSIFNPLQMNKEERYFDSLKRNLVEKVSIDLNFFTLKLDFMNTGCFKFDYNGEFENIKVKNKDGELVRGEKRGGSILILGEGEFFYIYSSKEFDKDLIAGACNKIEEKNYSIGLWRDLDVVSNESLNKLKREYENNYESLKEELNLPDSKDFSFSVMEEDNEILKVVRKKRGEVFSKSFPLQIVYKNGEIKYSIMRVEIW
jgi:hypothetical protein